ncbi:MAG: hypothetical protein ACOCVR_02170, partial [Myxococcota bacterium]
MNRDRLRIYLSDHLAASAALAARTKRSIRFNQGSGLEAVLRELLDETQKSIDAIEHAMGALELRGGRSKELAALAAERLGRLKLNGYFVNYSPLSRLEELEMLAAGAGLRRRLWETLKILGDEDKRLEELDLDGLQRRAGA